MRTGRTCGFLKREIWPWPWGEGVVVWEGVVSHFGCHRILFDEDKNTLLFDPIYKRAVRLKNCSCCRLFFWGGGGVEDRGKQMNGI